MNNITFLRVGDVLDRTGISRSTLHNWVQVGYFPKPHKHGKRITYWTEQEFQKWSKEVVK